MRDGGLARAEIGSRWDEAQGRGRVAGWGAWARTMEVSTCLRERLDSCVSASSEVLDRGLR